MHNGSFLSTFLCFFISTQLDLKNLFGCPSIARALFKIDIDCNMNTLYTEKAQDIAKAVI